MKQGLIMKSNTENTTSKKGKEAEEKALEYLLELGYELLQTNYRFGKKEIDIIMKDGDELVFIEVKAKFNEIYGLPELMVTPAKMKSILIVANFYIEQISYAGNSRFDIISMIKVNNEFQLSHFKDAFWPGVMGGGF